MSKSNYKATGCLWVFMELLCIALFLILFIMKLCGTPLKWWTVFGPLIVGGAITVAVFLVVILFGLIEDKNGKVDSEQ